MKVRTSYNECEYITAGKVYEVSGVTDSGSGGEILSDNGVEIFIVLPNQYEEPCAHLGLGHKGHWEIVE